MTVAKIHGELGWQPSHSRIDGWHEMVEWYFANLAWSAASQESRNPGGGWT
jgi:dTDP-D-glucose 4,6-dehydratase